MDLFSTGSNPVDHLILCFVMKFVFFVHLLWCSTRLRSQFSISFRVHYPSQYFYFISFYNRGVCAHSIPNFSFHSTNFDWIINHLQNATIPIFRALC